MIYSHTVEENKFNSFALFLGQLLQGQERYKTEIDSVLREAGALARGDKSLYELNRDQLPIILFLKNSDPDYFKNLSDLTKDVYKKALSSIEKKSSVF